MRVHGPVVFTALVAAMILWASFDPGVVLKGVPTPIARGFCTSPNQVGVRVLQYGKDFLAYYSPDTNKTILISLKDGKLYFGQTVRGKFVVFETLTKEQAKARYGNACQFLAAPEVNL